MDCKQLEWHKTSTGVGHHHRPGYYFPDMEFRTLLREPLPPQLAKQDEIPREEKFKTTYATEHDRKFPHGVLGQDYELYRKPPGHWKVNYVKDHAEKLQDPKFRRPLSPSNQKSEMKAEYWARPPLPEPETFGMGIQSYKLNDHHTDGPTKVMVPSTENPEGHGREIFNIDHSMVKYLDPYISTTHLDHRPFQEDEQSEAKHGATYWNCEEYPKAWGHGTKNNPLPKDAVPRDQPPMRDTMVFKDATQIGPMPKKSVAVPHRGLKTEQQEKFEWPAHPNHKYSFMSEVPSPWCTVEGKHGTLVPGGPTAAFASPYLYDTEYQNIGRDKVVTVT